MTYWWLMPIETWEVLDVGLVNSIRKHGLLGKLKMMVGSGAFLLREGFSRFTSFFYSYCPNSSKENIRIFKSFRNLAESALNVYITCSYVLGLQ